MKLHTQALCCTLLGMAMSVPALCQGGSGGNQPESSLSGVGQSSTSKMSSAQPTEADKQFLATAAQSDQNEMALSRVAMQKGSNPAVKSYAKKMITDHTKLTNSMKPYASKWGVTPPTGPDADHQQELTKLNGMSGSELDKEYIDQMVTDHGKALDAFQTESSSTQLPKFKATVTKGQSVVSEHKTMADNLKSKL